MPVLSSLLWDESCQLFIIKDKNASFICVVADKKLPVLSLSQINIASFLLLKIKNASIILMFQIKNASFLFNVTDQDCQMKNIRFICIVGE